MNPRPGIILQARLGSRRLPGKVLARVGQATVLEHCLGRLLASGVARVVLATTTRPEDDAVATCGERAGVAVFRGSSEDVLGRFAQAAEQFELDPVIRATADNPAVDPAAPERLLTLLKDTGADYASEVGLPVGGGVEAMAAAALHYSASAATAVYDREHVTTFIKNNPRTFRLVSQTAPRRMQAPSLSLTVDTPEDLAWVNRLFAAINDPEPRLETLIAAARELAQEAA